MNLDLKPFALSFILCLQAPAAALAEQGKDLFKEHCAACHTVGGGDSVGPDLKGVAGRRKAGWLKRVIAEPDRLTAENDPEKLALVKKWGMEMPNVGISESDAVKILEYLAGVQAARPAAAAKNAAGKSAGAAAKAAAAETMPAGSAANGRELFTGTKSLAAGGPACAACHSAASVNSAAGGTLAVSLTGAYKKMGGSGLKAVLTALPFPVKAAAFKNRPVTQTEIADLSAFLEEAGKAGPEPGAGSRKLVLGGLAAALAGLLLIALVWSGRKKKSVKDEILTRQAKTF